MTQIPVPQCADCKHFLVSNPIDETGGWYCLAFRARPPEEILWGEHDHREPYPGDNGIQFEAIDYDRHRHRQGGARPGADEAGQG